MFNGDISSLHFLIITNRKNMNRINPNKLLLSKWTAVKPKQKERHFIVTKLIRDDDETVIACKLEAVINKRSREIDWRELQQKTDWTMGWG